jgi:ribosomal protein S18 acetylase RimI-like enzyme
MNKKFIAVALSGLLLAGGGYWYLTKPKVQEQPVVGSAIVSYCPQKHKIFIRQQFKENWYWLISSPDYDINYALDTHSPNHYEPQYKGKMSIVVLEVEGTPVGFGTYYMRNNFQGEILFIEVAKQFRGKRYAAVLVEYAVADLKKMGAKIIKLATRIDNPGARKLYTRLGFPQVSENRGFVHYRKEL